MDYQLTEQQQALKKEFESFFSHEMRNAPTEILKGGFDSKFLSEKTWSFHKSMARKLGEKRMAGARVAQEIWRTGSAFHRATVI